MECVTCKTDWTLLGQVFGTWRCPDCCRKAEQERIWQHQQALDELRKRHAERRCVVHIPGPTLPPFASDEEAQRLCDESLCCSWERLEDGTVRCWGEM